MKKSGILNAALSRTVAAMGHGDLIVIGDAGLPVPPGVPCIDLAVCRGVPRFVEVLASVRAELEVERTVIAAEAGLDVRTWIGPADEISHEDFKQLSSRAVAIVRTGEATPYANAALFSGVTF